MDQKFSFPFPSRLNNESTDLNYNWSNLKILITENEANHYMILEKYIQKTGAKLIWATDGLEAINHAKTNPNICVVLMGIDIPNMNGYEATRHIKKIKSSLPIIAQTVDPKNNEQILSIQAGCDGYLIPPIQPKSLLEKINQFL